jgi:hypothetical protein
MRAFIPFLALTIAACGGSKEDGQVMQPATVAVGHEYVVGFGETLKVEGGLSLEFTTLAEESRCPTGVTCVWEGNARILLTATTPSGITSIELNTNARFPTRAFFGDYAIDLRKLEPYPSANSPTGLTPPVSAYEATLFIDGVAHPTQGP